MHYGAIAPKYSALDFHPCTRDSCRLGNFVNLDANKDNHCHSATASADISAIIRELATLITQAINLEISPDQIDPDAPLYGDGLGLDSIDILEVALVVAKRYNLQIKAESEENHVIFSSLRNLAQYVAAHTTSVGSPQV
jgi:acyl carrier protein